MMRNRRRTVVLLAVFAATIMPGAGWLTLYYSGLMLMTSSQLFATVVDLGAKSHAAGMILSMACGLPLVALAIGLEGLYASRLLLRLARGQAVSRAQEPELWEVVETLSKACGLPPPRIYVIESPGANAFSTGWHARDAALAITRGLLVLLDRRELEGVVAHELSHIRN